MISSFFRAFAVTVGVGVGLFTIFSTSTALFNPPAVDKSSDTAPSTVAVTPSSSDVSKPNLTPTKTSDQSPSTEYAVPYTVVGEYRRYDDKPIYQVLVGPVSVGTEEFKSVVKSVIHALARLEGNADFGAWVYDNRDVAEKNYQRNVGEDMTAVELEDLRDASERHLIANYSGGSSIDEESGPGLYNISWFPAASTETPEVGRWQSEEQWKP